MRKFSKHFINRFSECTIFESRYCGSKTCFGTRGRKIVPKFAPVLMKSTFVSDCKFLLYLVWLVWWVCLQNRIYLDETHGSKHLYVFYMSFIKVFSFYPFSLNQMFVLNKLL